MEGERTPSWTVLLLGGSGGCGKSRLALKLAAQHRAALTQVDDVRLALQRLTSASDDAILHFFLSDARVWERPAAELRDGLIAIARRMEPALEVIVDHQLATAMPLVLEGDGVSPALAGRLRARHPGRVDALFVIEDDAAALLGRMRARGRGFTELPDARQNAQVAVNLLYGRWLREEARRLGLPTTTPSELLLPRRLRDGRVGDLDTVLAKA